MKLFVWGVCGLVVEYLVAIEVTRVRFPADAVFCFRIFLFIGNGGRLSRGLIWRMWPALAMPS